MEKISGAYYSCNPLSPEILRSELDQAKHNEDESLRQDAAILSGFTSPSLIDLIHHRQQN